MPYALLDNATLTGVQRILGDVPVRTRDSVEADIAALENLVQAILFYDDIIAIDDYKAEHRLQRSREFNYVRFLDPAEFGLAELEGVAHEEARVMQPEIRGGEFADEDFRRFFERLKMHIICTWDLAGSAFELTMKLLGNRRSEEYEKYSKLSAAIFGELADLRKAGETDLVKPKLLDSRGKEIGDNYTLTGKGGRTVRNAGSSRALQAFLAALHWLAYRTIYYSRVADWLRADLWLYPVRQPFHINYMQRRQRYEDSVVRELIATLSQRATRGVEIVLNAGRHSLISLSLPLFSAWLVSQTHDVKKVIRAARELRKHDRIATAREQLKELRLLFDSADTQELSKRVQRLVRELDRVIDAVQHEFGVRTRQGVPLSTVARTYNGIASLGGLPAMPEIGESLRLPPFLGKWWPRSGVGALYRDISRDLTDFARLGRLSDYLSAAVVVDAEGRSHRPKVEEPEFRHVISDRKIPM